MHRLSLCALGHTTGSDVCASSDGPGETAFAQSCLSFRCSHNKLVKSFFLLVVMRFK